MKRLIKRIFRVLSTVFSCDDRIIMRKVKVFKNNSFLQRSLYVLFNLLVLFLLLGIPFLGIASIRYDCNYDLGRLTIERKEDWDFIKIKDLGLIEESGEPILPVDYIHLIIPEGQEACSIAVKVESSFKISDKYRIKRFIPNNDSSLIDSTVSLKGGPYPGKRAEIVGTGSFGGNKIVDIKVYPVDYYPGSGEIVFFDNLSIELFHGHSMASSVRQLYRDPYTEHIIQKALTSLVDNDYDISSYSYKTVTIKRPFPGESNSSYPVYLVITADSLKEAFDPLIHWITKKGIRANAISVDSILQNYSYDPVSAIYDSAGAIRAFLMDAYENGVQWVLLGGDEGIIPVRYGTSENNNSTVPERPPSDLYYSDLDGNWNVDGDDLYGEPIDDAVDPYSELFIGRLPCNNSREISNWIEKILSYERNPGNGDTDYLTKVCWAAADQMKNQPDYIIGNGFYPSYIEHDTTMLEGSGGSSPYGSEVVEKMSEKFGWFNMYLHGSPDQVTVSARHYNEAGPDRDFLVSVDSCDEYFENLHPNGCRVETGNGLDSLNNKDYYGIMYLTSCYQGAFDFEHFELFSSYCGPSMAEAFTMLPEKGGPAFLGYTRYGRVVSSMVLHMRFLGILFNDTIPNNLGVVEALSRTQVYPHFIHLSHTLFGCPLMPVWTKQPKKLKVDFCPSIPRKKTYLTIKVTSSDEPIENAYICVWKDNEVYEYGFSGVNGSLTMSLELKTEGKIYITVSKDNFMTFEDSVYVSDNVSKNENVTMTSPSFKVKRALSQEKMLFELELPTAGRVQLDIFDITGRRVKRLVDGRLEVGAHQISWLCDDSSGNSLPGGVYFYRLENNNYNFKGKIIVMR